MATQDEIIEEASEELKNRRHAIERAADEPWCEGALGWLGEVTGLFLPSMTSCERTFPAFRGGPEFPFTTREIYNHLEELRSQRELLSPHNIVTTILKNLPVEKAVEPAGIFDVLGQYIREQDVIGARVEVYWAKIEAYCTLENTKKLKPVVPKIDGINLQPALVGRVVMLHELAHYVTLQGCCGKRNWQQFGRSETFFKEVAAQKATADVIDKKAQDLAETFETMLKSQSKEYTSHAEIPGIMKKTPRLRKEGPINFWTFFRNDIPEHKAITSIDDLKKHIDRWAREGVKKIEQKPVLKKGMEEHGLDLTF